MTGYSDRILRGGTLLRWQRFSRFRKAAKAIRTYVSDPEKATLLDIGAADGIGVPFLKPLVADYVGVNYYENHSREFKENYPELDVITADARQLPIPDAGFDVVVSFETLHLIPPDRMEVLSEIYRVLKPGGIFICSVPIETGHTAILKYVARNVTGHQLRGQTVRQTLRQFIHPFVPLALEDKGKQVGFDANQFRKQIKSMFTIQNVSRVPIPILLPMNVVIVAKKNK